MSNNINVKGMSMEALSEAVSEASGGAPRLGSAMGRKIRYSKSFSGKNEKGEVIRSTCTTSSISLNDVVKRVLELMKEKGPRSKKDKDFAASITKDVVVLNKAAIKESGALRHHNEFFVKVGEFFSNLFSGYHIRMGATERLLKKGSKEVANLKTKIKEEKTKLEVAFLDDVKKEGAKILDLVDKLKTNMRNYAISENKVDGDKNIVFGNDLESLTGGFSEKVSKVIYKVDAYNTAKAEAKVRVGSYKVRTIALGAEIGDLIKERLGKLKKATSLEGNEVIEGAIDTLESEAKKVFAGVRTDVEKLGAFTGSDEFEGVITQQNEDIAKAVTDAKAKLYKESPGEGGGGADAK